MSGAIERGDFPEWTGQVTVRGGFRRRYCPRPDLRRLVPEQVARIRVPGANLTALAREFGITRVAVWKIRKYVSYKDLP